jgi:hypothetical protein
MRGRQVRRLVSDTAETVIGFAVSTKAWLPRSKILPFGLVATLLAAAAPPMLFHAGMASVAADSTLKCYDRAGNYEPCAASAIASLRLNNPATAASPRLNDPATAAPEPASWTATALYQPESWATVAATDQSADWKTSAPAARHALAPHKRSASAICARRSIPCFFSALRKEVTHMASVAAVEAGARSNRGLKERFRPRDL